MFRRAKAVVGLILALSAPGLAACGSLYVIPQPNKWQLAPVREKCDALYNEPQVADLGPLMVLHFTQGSGIPSKRMITNAGAPSETQRLAIRRLEEVNRTCTQMLKEIRYKSSATEDIMEKRLSDLRYGLYTGELSFGAYNIGVARIQLQQARFETQQIETAAAGRQAGAQRAAQIAAAFEQAAVQSQIQAMQFQLNSYQTVRRTYWNCTASPAGVSSVRVSCY